jgi:hypothetical protein
LEIGKTRTLSQDDRKKRTDLIEAYGENRYNNEIFDKGSIISNYVSFFFID